MVKLLFEILLIFPYTEMVTFNNNPGTINLNENDDSQTTLWSISATCYPSTNNYDTVLGIDIFTGTTTHTVACETCKLSSVSPSAGILFYLSGNTVYKRACSDTACGNCPSCTACSTSNGCMNGPSSYSITVKCSTTSYDNDDSGTSSFTVSVAQEETLTISLADALNADNSMSAGTVLGTASKSSGQTIVAYTKTTAVVDSYLLGTANMFELNTANGEIYVKTNPSVEYDYTYTMQVCIHSRRRNSCKTTTINFDGCFQTPNCKDQSDTTSFSDQFATGGTMFTMTYNSLPSAHFSSISSTWQNLYFVIDSQTLNEVSLDASTGVMTSTGNITVWPDYPYSTHTIVVRVTNPGHSCHYSATCTISMQIAFTNWPIRITNLPTQRTHHEDTDARTLKLTIITYDYNNPDHDNVTCEVVTNEEPTLLELTQDGNYSYNSWKIYKKRCQQPGCGYIDASFLCDTGIGCLNYDLDNEYTMTVKCKDAYGTDDTQTFTLKVTENQPPVYTNTPTTITVNTDAIAHLDNIFSIFYTDAEKETLDYNYTISPLTPSLFAFSDRGNYYNDTANVTTTVFQWDLVNTTFSIDFCGRERRNIVCSSFTIDIREYCGPTPVCSSDATTKTDKEAIAGLNLFSIAVTSTGHTPPLSYVIISEYPDLFSVDQTTGIVTLSSDLEVTNPPNPSTYSFVANVKDTQACDVAACDFSVEVTFTNEDISITNMATVNRNIHEDTITSVTIVRIATSDANTIDGVDCEVDETASTPANNNIFFAVETDTASNVFDLVSKEGPGFDVDVADTYEVVVVCKDNYGSSDTATATVSILENQVPTIDNLNAGDIINVDPMTVKSGNIIFTLQTSDDENDPLVYSCNVTNSFVPLQCLSDGVVSMKRDVRIPDEEGAMYEITLCIEEEMHNHVLCETLTVNISSSKTNPELNNLPATISFAENTAVGATLFTATVEDPDALDVHTFTMTVYPKTAQSTFSLDANAGVLTLQNPLDYETLNQYEFLFTVRDEYLPGLEEKYLSLTVTDVNEAPVLTLHNTNYETIEETTGYTVATLNYSCTDVDTGQSHTLTISSGTYVSYFTLDSATGIITYAQDWDFESNGALPQTTSLEITCDDGNGLSDAGNIVVNIALVNEFSPVLSTYYEEIIIYSNQTLIDPLFTITASDSDFGDDGQFEFLIIGVGKGSKYFTISNTGSLYISNYIDWRYNSTIAFTIRVSDGETNPRFSHVVANVTYLSTYVRPIPQKEKAKCLLCTNLGVMTVSALCVEGFICLILLVHICCRMKAYEICQLKPKPRLNSVSDMRRAIQERQESSADPYRPESTTHALPKTAPPSPFMYHAPPKERFNPPPAAAEYIPSTHSANNVRMSDPSNLSRRKQDLNPVRPVNNKGKVPNVPSLFHNKSYAPATMSRPWESDDTNIYRFTQRDSMLARPDVAVEDEIMLRPMFSSPHESVLYSDNSRNLHDIGAPADALDY